MPNLRPIEFLLIAAVILIIVGAIYLIVRAASNAGVNAQGEPLEARLAELSDLRSRGVISEDEYQSARSSVLHQG